MLRVGDALVQLLWYGGGLGRAIVLSGALAAAGALGSLGAMLLRRGQARTWGAVTLVLAACPMALGAAATLHGRMQSGAAVQDLAPGYLRDHALQQQLLQARLFSQGGLVLGAFPLVAGAAGMLAAPARRTHSLRARPGRAPPSGDTSHPASPQSLSRSRWALWIAMALALVAAAGALWGACAPLSDTAGRPPGSGALRDAARCKSLDKRHAAQVVLCE